MKRTILKGMVRFYLYRMKKQDISAKIGLYRLKTAIYHRNLDYISETPDISPEIAIYHRKSDYIDEKRQYISETPDISPKIAIYRRN